MHISRLCNHIYCKRTKMRMKNETQEITIPEDIRLKALVPLQKMLDISK